MQTTTSKYVPPVVSNYGQEGHSEDLANLAAKRKLTKKCVPDAILGTDKLYGYEGGGGFFAAFSSVAANVTAVVNAVVYSNAAAVTLAIAVAAVVTFPGNMQGIQNA